MFCGNCGKQLADDVKFCDGCGAQQATANTAVSSTPSPEVAPKPAAVPAQPNPIVGDFLKTIKGFFSANMLNTVGGSIKSTGLEWLLVAAVSVVAYILALCLNMSQIIDSLFGSLGAMIGDELYNFGETFLYGLLISVGTYFLMSGAIFLTVKYIFKKDVNIHSVFNLVATASLPLACAYVVNGILGFVWFPFVYIFCVVGMLATAILLYKGIQELAELEESPYLVYLGIWAVVVTIVVVIISVALDGAVEDAVSSLGYLGSFFS